jgi:predicted ATPase/DNA-binding CsgD family transcriptional regulator
LGISGETTWRVPSLTLPVEEAPSSAEALATSDAVRLFVSRAVRVRRSFRVTGENAPTLARICTELDGIPLAIELAAARMGMLSLEQVAAGLQDRFRLLAGGERTELPRHQTLRASVDWSHGLLSDRSRTLFRRLAVFRGGFTLGAAEKVGSGAGLERVAILDLLASLVDKSLVVAEERGPVMRYRLLESVRQYALERLEEAGELDAVLDRHRNAFLALAEGVAPRLVSPEQPELLQLLDDDAANFEAALDRALETDADQALRLCIALVLWWRLRGLFPAGQRSFARAFDAAEPSRSELRARGLWGWSYLLAVGGDHRKAMPTAREALEIAEAVGDRSTIARALHVLALFQRFSDPVGSRPGLERSCELARTVDDHWCLIHATQVLAYSYLLCDEFEEGERLLQEVFPLTEDMGYVVASHWFGASMGPFARCDRDHFLERAELAVAAAREVGDPIVEAWPQAAMAHFELAQGRVEAALARLEASREHLIASGAGMALPITETVLAHARATVGDFSRARADLERVVESGGDAGHQLAQATAQLADVLRVSSEPAAAAERARAALELSARIESPRLVAWCKEILGRLAAGRREWAEAEALLHEALATRLERQLWLWMPQTLDVLAEVAAGLESHEEAARIAGVAERARANLGLVRWAPDERGFAQLERKLRAELGEDPFEIARREGAALPLDEAVTWLRRARGTRRRPPGGWESLTPTELEVVRHAAAGLTNPQIGERMFITRGTVKVHLSHVYAKLGVHNRAELAAEAARRLPALSL